MCEPSNEIDPGVVYTYSNTISPFDASVVDVKVGNDFRFKPFFAGSGILIDETTNPGGITVTATGSSTGYTFSTLPGGDASLVGTLVGTDFQFRGIRQGQNIVFDNTNPNFVQISSVPYTYSTISVAPVSVSVVATQVGNDFRFRPLIAGSGISFDTTTTPNAIIIASTSTSDTYSTLPVVGVTASVVANKVGNDFRFRGFIPGTNVTIDQITTPNAITISSAQYTFSDAAIGTSIRGALTGTNFSFRTLIAGNNISFDTTTTPGAIILNVPTPPVYTYSSNVVPGSDANITAPAVGNDFRFKPLNAGTNTTIEETTLPGAITINSIQPTYSSNIVPGSDANITATQVGNDFRFKPLNAGANVNIEETTLPGAITISALSNTYTYSSNVVPGSDANITAPQVGNDFRFKPVNGGTNVIIEETTLPGAVTFNGPTYASNTVPGSDANITATQVGNEFRFKPLNAGNNVTIDETTLPGAITFSTPTPPVYTYSSNIVPGSDANITATQVGNDFRFKPLNGGTNVTVEETTLPGAVTVNGPTYASNVVIGADADITATQVGNQFRFKPFNGGTNVTVEETTLAGAITINGPTYASNTVPGSDANITATQVGNEFRFKPLNGGTNVTIEETTLAGAITINGPTYASNTVPGSDANITATQVGNEFRFKPLNAGNNVTIDETTLPGAITINSASSTVYTYSSNVVAGSDANITATQVGNDFRFKPLNAGTNITIEETTLPGAITINSTSTSATLQQNNILYVDEQFGNNATGVRERLDRPYQTISAALTASSPGDLIYILPGTYTVLNITPPSNLSMYLSGGVIFNGTSGSNVFIVNSGITFAVFGDGVINNNFLASVNGNLYLNTRTISGRITNNGTVNVIAQGYTTAELFSLNSGSTTLQAETINSPITTALFTVSTTTHTLTCRANSITCAGLLNSSTNACSIDITANSIVNTSTSLASILLQDASGAGGQSNCYATIKTNTFSVASGLIASPSSLKTLNFMPVISLIANNIFSTKLVSSTTLFLATSGIILVKASKLIYAGTGNFSIFNGNVYADIDIIAPDPSSTVTVVTFGINGVNIKSNIVVANGTIGNGNYNINSLTGTGLIFNAGAGTTLNYTGKIFNTTNTSQLVFGSGNIMNINIDFITINSTFTLGTSALTTIINARTITLTGTQTTLATDNTSVYINAESVTDLLFEGNGTVYLDVDNYLLTGTTTFASVASVNGNIKNMTIVGNNILNNISNTMSLNIDVLNIPVFITTSVPVMNMTQNVIINLQIGRLNFNNANRPFLTTLAGTTNITIDNFYVNNSSNSLYMFNLAGIVSMSVNNLYLQSSTANGLFMRKTGGSNTTVDVKNIIGTSSNILRLFNNQTNAGPFVIRIGYALINCELLRCEISGHNTYLYATRAECTSATNLITNTTGGVLEFGGSLKTAGSHILDSTANMVANILPSKFVSTGNCIRSTILTTMYFAPTVSRNGVSVSEVLVTPLGNLTIAGGMT